MSDKEENKKLYDAYYKDINSRILSNMENYDKAILSLSVTMLGLSIAFIKNIVSFEKAKDLIFLECSWLFLVLAVISTIASFIAGNKANNKHLEFAEDYYLNDNDKALDKKSKWTTCTEYLNMGSGLFFILGIILTVYFAYVNIEVKEEDMPQKDKVERGMPPSRLKPKPSTEKKPLTEGTVPPKMPPKPKDKNE